MKRIMFNDWQEMALKKDIEKIIRRMDSNNTVFYSVCWEITLTFAAIFVENIIHIENAKKCIVLFFIFLLAVIPPLVIIVAKVTVLIFRILKSIVLDAADDLAAGTDDVADLIGRNLDGFDA